MSEPTLVLSPRFHADSQDMWRAAVQRGWGVHRAIRYAGPEDATNCCVYGELMMCDIMADRLDLALLDPPNDWLAGLPQHYLKREVQFCIAADLFTHMTGKMFVKPANDKVFQYGIYERPEDVPLRFIDPTCPILLSEVVSWDLEVRLYVLDGKILTAEYYRLVGDHEEQAVRGSATQFGEQLLDEFGQQLPSGVVVDVGHIEGRGWAVVEANQAYASGIYGEADTNAVLDICYRSAGAAANVQDIDRRFIRS